MKQFRNRMGMMFMVSTPEPGKTSITLLGHGHPPKRIVLNVPQPEVEAAWGNWVIQNLSIQQAFRFLNAEEREFLMTGITPEEWEETFGVEG